MHKSVQVFHDATGAPSHVLMSWVEYNRLISPDGKAGNGLLYNDNQMIRGVGPSGMNDIDVGKLHQYFKGIGAKMVPINARTKPMSSYALDEMVCIEYMIRYMFVGESSSYVNVLQCTPAVVDALVKSGKFKRTRVKTAVFEEGFTAANDQRSFYRNVQALEVL